MTAWPIHARFDGPIVMIGYGSIGRGTLPLILRHIDGDRSRITVIDPDDSHRQMVEAEGANFIKAAVLEDSYLELLTPLLTAGPGRAFMVNLSVDGCMIVDALADPIAGTKAEVTLLEGVTVSGEVVWSADGKFGVGFYRPLSDVTLRYFTLGTLDHRSQDGGMTDRFGRGLPPMDEKRRYG